LNTLEWLRDSFVAPDLLRHAGVDRSWGFGAAPLFLRSGGTIPVVSAFQDVLGIPTPC